MGGCEGSQERGWFFPTPQMGCRFESQPPKTRSIADSDYHVFYIVVLNRIRIIYCISLYWPHVHYCIRILVIIRTIRQGFCFECLQNDFGRNEMNFLKKISIYTIYTNTLWWLHLWLWNEFVYLETHILWVVYITFQTLSRLAYSFHWQQNNRLPLRGTATRGKRTPDRTFPKCELKMCVVQCSFSTPSRYSVSRIAVLKTCLHKMA